MSLQSTDPIADLLTRIRNAAMVGKTEIRVPTSGRAVEVTHDHLRAGRRRLPGQCVEKRVALGPVGGGNRRHGVHHREREWRAGRLHGGAPARRQAPVVR